MTETQYQQIRNKIDREHERQLQALDLVRQMANQVDERSRDKGLSRSVREVVAILTGNFKVGDVDVALQSSFPELPHPLKRTSLSSIMVRLEAENFVSVVSRGKGKRATIYKRNVDPAP